MIASAFRTTGICAVLLLTPPLAAAQTAAPAKPPAAAVNPEVQPAALQALDTMSAYLRTLQSFEIKADLLTDEVTDDGRKLQINSTATYRVRKPNAFTIELASDRKVRKFYYDGKTITVSAPRAGYYAQASAPPTIRQTLDKLSDEYDIEVPLEDLFHWGEPGDSRAALTSGFYVGPARLNGVETDQYAFSTADLDWQIWIQRGPKPAPRKIVITSLFDPAQPQFSAELTWNPTPAFKTADFTFTPPPNAKTITFASTDGSAQ